MEIFCGLAGLCIVLVVVAVVGHLLWIAGAAIFGAAPGPRSVDRCPGCAAKLYPGQIHCLKCGFAITSPHQGTLDEELAATRRQLERLTKSNKVSAQTCETVIDAIRDDLRERALGFPAPKMKSSAVSATDLAGAVAKTTETPLEAPVAAASVADARAAGVPAAAAVFVASSAQLPVEQIPQAAERPSHEPERPRALAGLLQTFMEEKNIRWGELISGLLIVGSSVGLVISLWATLKEAIPYFPVAVFLTATAAMHAAGLYTLRRWRLKSTSRGLLLVSTLLVPLNVLAAMVLNETKPAYGTIDYAAFAIGLSVLAAIAVSAARVLNRRNPWPLVLAVVGTAVGMSTIGRLARPGGEMGRTLGLFALPFFSFLIGAIAHVVNLSEGRRLTVRRVAQSFRFLGIAAFGLILAGGLLASKSGDIRETLALLAPMLAAVAATLTGAGLVVHQGITNPEQLSFRVAGTSIALGGGLLAIAALALAWPRPDLLVAVGLLEAIAFTSLPWFAGFAILQVFATAALSLAVLVGYEWAAGEISVFGATTEQLTLILLTARSALILALLSLVADGIACLLSRFRMRQHASAYFTSSVVHQIVAVAIAVGAVYRDVPDQDLVTAVFALVALRWLVAAWWINRSYASWVAASLLFAALAHGLVMNDRLCEILGAHGLAPADPWKLSLLLHATICLGCAVFTRRRDRDLLGAPDQIDWSKNSPFAGTANSAFMAAVIMTSALAVPMVLDVRSGHILTHGLYGFWTAAIWLAIAVLEASAGIAIASQSLATIAVGFAVTGYCLRQPWWTGLFNDPLYLNWEFSTLALWSGLWLVARRLCQPVTGLARILISKPTSVDRIVLGGVALGLVATCWLAVWPGTIAELSSVTTQVLGSPYAVAVLIPFGIGAVLAATYSLGRQQWPKVAAYVFGTCIVSAIILSAPLHLEWVWPGLPTSYGQGWGAGAWAALTLSLLAVLAAHWERPNRATLAGIALLLSAVPYLIACRWDADLQTATALRWSVAITGLVVAVAWGAWAAWRKVLRFPSQSSGDTSSAVPNQALFLRNSLIAATSLPVLVLTSQALLEVLGEGRIPLAATAGSFIVRMAPYLSYGVPLGILAAAFAIYAIADRRALWGLAATFLVQFALGFAVALSLILSSELRTVAEITRFLQEMGLLTVTGAAVWCAIQTLAQWRPRTLEPELRLLQATVLAQLGFVAVIAFLLSVGATVGLWISPEPLLNSVLQSGAPIGWLFLISTTTVFVWSRRGDWPLSAIKIGLLFLSVAAVLGATSLGTWNSAANWLAFHSAMSGWCGVLALAAVAPLVTRSPERHGLAVAIADRALLLLPVVLAFAFKAELFDPQRPWWAASVMIWLSICVTLMAVGAESRMRSYLSFLLAVTGFAFVGVRPWLEGERPFSGQPLVDLAHITILGMGLYGVAWLAIELTHELRWNRPFDDPSSLQPVHHYAAHIGTFGLGLATLLVLASQRQVPNLSSATPLAWGALGTIVALAVGALWERRAEHPFPILYGVGLIAIATVLDWRQLDGRNLIFAAAASVAGYVVLSGVLWTVRGRMKEAGLKLGMSPFAIDGQRIAFWLGPVSLVAATLVISVEFWVVLTFEEPWLRIGGALATLALGGGLALLTTTRAREILQTAALGVGALAAVQFGWGLMDPIGSASHEELRRAIRMMAMLGATTFIYGLPLVRLASPESSWFASIRRAAIGMAATTIATLALVLLFEVGSFDPTLGAPVTIGESLLVAATLVLLAAGLISLALLPGRDPFLHVEGQRFFYVYASEVVCGLLIAHLYLTNPQFFRQTLQPYWPLVVMAIAYAGTAVSEFFRRMKVTVLSQPLEHTAAFLPVLPVIGFWFFSSDLNYSTMLVVVGLLYLFLSLRRGSFWYSAAAAVVGNATLCRLFSEHGVSLLLHPQMFVIPPCLTILAAAQLNRERLDDKALASLRYFAMTAIYVSSTGEMFQHGIGTTLWLPMLLAGLSVLGVLAGIVLRVRAFLYLGTSFLVLSIVSMVWHAARSIGHVWPWWVFLFALGVGLLTLFGVFEKKRPEVLALVGSLREWER
jgi:hypothetical protein